MGSEVLYISTGLSVLHPHAKRPLRRRAIGRQGRQVVSLDAPACRPRTMLI